MLERLVSSSKERVEKCAGSLMDIHICIWFQVAATSGGGRVRCPVGGVSSIRAVRQEAGWKTICSSSVGWDEGIVSGGALGTESTTMAPEESSSGELPVQLVSCWNFLRRGHERSRARWPEWGSLAALQLMQNSRHSVAATRLTGLGSLEPWLFTGYGSVSRTDWSDSALPRLWSRRAAIPRLAFQASARMLQSQATAVYPLHKNWFIMHIVYRTFF